MMMPLIHVIGMGLAGSQSLVPAVRSIVQSADLLIGAQRHLAAASVLFSGKTPEKWSLGDFTEVFAALKAHLREQPESCVVVLATGDPLFFGLGRLLLSSFPAEQLMFYPQLSAVQLAFSRLKMPWQDATFVSVHGRGEALLCQALKRGDPKIAVLTDGVLTPQAIAQLINALDLPIHYRQWVCENLGGDDEHVSLYDSHASVHTGFAPLNVVVLVKCTAETLPNLASLPLIGLPDSVFTGYADRPMLMTKREIRLLILGAIAPLDHQVIWDIGAGTGSISIELSRLCPHAQVYAIEKSAMGAALIAENAEKLAIAPIKVIKGEAPAALSDLVKPNRVFIGGSSGQLINILNYLHKLLLHPASASALEATHALEAPLKSHDFEQVRSSQAQSHLQGQTQGQRYMELNSQQNNGNQDAGNQAVRVVLSLATLEHLAEVVTWCNQPNIAKDWQCSVTQVNIARSLPVGPLTRFSPLNPVTILTLVQKVSAQKI